MSWIDGMILFVSSCKSVSNACPRSAFGNVRPDMLDLDYGKLGGEVGRSTMPAVGARAVEVSRTSKLEGVQSASGPAKRMRFSSGSETIKVLAPHGSFLSA